MTDQINYVDVTPCTEIYRVIEIPVLKIFFIIMCVSLEIRIERKMLMDLNSQNYFLHVELMISQKRQNTIQNTPHIFRMYAYYIYERNCPSAKCILVDVLNW